jgi:hypothetical protein
MINREEAVILLNKYVKNENYKKHSFAVEAILTSIAPILHRDSEIWGLTGLLHDLDYEYTQGKPEQHATMTADILEGLVPDTVIQAIKAHNYQHTMQIPQTSLDKALIAADALSGLLIATALVMPSKTLAEVEVSTVIKKYKDPSFARGCNRKRIDLCEDFGMELEQFINISLDALQHISGMLGL